MIIENEFSACELFTPELVQAFTYRHDKHCISSELEYVVRHSELKRINLQFGIVDLYFFRATDQNIQPFIPCSSVVV
jgi:hypothetical protein